MDTIPTLQRVVDQTTAIVDGVNDAQLGDPSPCAEWAVRDVLNHIIGGSKLFTISVRDGDVSDEQLTELILSDNLGQDFKTSWATASTNAMEAFAGSDLGTVVRSPLGEMPIGAIATYLVFDLTTHAADLAHATGQTIEDDDLLSTALEVGRQTIGSEGRDPSRFDPEQPAPDGASRQDQLLAFAGRSI